MNDAVIVQAANDVEQLAVNLSRTIWQKIVILDGVLLPPSAEAASAAPEG